jgi:hypothetical protein
MSAAAVPANGQLVSYEPSWGTYPEEQGWERLAVWCTPERAIEDGWLVQNVGFLDCEPGSFGELELFRRTFGYLTGSPTYFHEWVSISDGPAEELIYTAPSSMVASSHVGTVSNHFTLASNRIRYIRDVNDLPIVWVDIDPTTPHVFRLEYRNTPPLWYVWTIDGVVVDEGVPEGQFPSTNPITYGLTIFGATSVLDPSTTRWRYIRAGEIPGPPGEMDFTNDDLIDHSDYYLFHWYHSLSGPAIPHARGWSVGDSNGDGSIALDDFQTFQNVFTGNE